MNIVAVWAYKYCEESNLTCTVLLSADDSSPSDI